MVEFRVEPEFGGGRILLHFADPGYDGSKWATSDKYNFILSLEQAHELILELKDALMEASFMERE